MISYSFVCSIRPNRVYQVKQGNSMPTLQWRHNEPDGILNHKPQDCLQFVQVQIKENIKALRHCPLWGEFISDQWIPRTKGQ